MLNVLNNSSSQIEEVKGGQSIVSAEGKIPKIGSIKVDRELCIGAQTCVALAPEVFEMDSENKAVVKNPKGADDETILMAARSCPTLAIFIYDEKGKQIFP